MAKRCKWLKGTRYVRYSGSESPFWMREGDGSRYTTDRERIYNGPPSVICECEGSLFSLRFCYHSLLLVCNACGRKGPIHDG